MLCDTLSAETNFNARTCACSVCKEPNPALDYSWPVMGRVSLARENEAGAVGGRKSIFSMLAYRTLFCFWL